MQSPAVQFVPSLVTEDDDEVEEDNVYDKKEVGDAEEKFHLSGGGGCSKQSKQTKIRKSQSSWQQCLSLQMNID